VASIETKERLLDAAELLFAENGFASTSLRAITSRAGVNIAAVNFHFGTKFSLLLATLDRRLQPISRKQLEGLRMAEDVFGDGPVDLETVLRALIMPVLRMQEDIGQAGDHFLALVGQAHRAPDKKIRTAFHKLVDEVMQKYLPVFERALPSASRQELQLKLYLVMGSVTDVVGWRLNESDMVDEIPPRDDPLPMEDMLLRFAAAGMRS